MRKVKGCIKRNEFMTHSLWKGQKDVTSISPEPQKNIIKPCQVVVDISKNNFHLPKT